MRDQALKESTSLRIANTCKQAMSAELYAVVLLSKEKPNKYADNLNAANAHQGEISAIVNRNNDLLEGILTQLKCIREEAAESKRNYLELEKQQQSTALRVRQLEYIMLRKLIYAGRVAVVKNNAQFDGVMERQLLSKYSSSLNHPASVTKGMKRLINNQGGANQLGNEVAHDIMPHDVGFLADLVCKQDVDRSDWIDLFRFLLQRDPLTIVFEEMAQNIAMLFLKPHANNPKTQELMTTTFLRNGIKIVQEGEFTGEQIDAGMHIDQHYYTIASKAILLAPAQIPVPADKFQDKFGLSWETALADGLVFNALDACKELGVDAEGLDKIWNGADKMKFGGGFYCGLIELEGKKLYTFNAFFMTMRAKFVAPGTSIHYYVVEFNPKDLSWADFRGKVLGPTDPKEAPEGALRGLMYKNWAELGLAYEPNTGDNCVHASASPFEGLAERLNWLKVEPENDIFGAQCLAAGIPAATLKEWSVDPQVKGKSIFDQLENLDVADCLAKMVELGK